jgi:acyl-CoA dehydrogenase
MSKSVPIPFSEPPWLMGLPSAYYNESHKKWQKTCRALVDRLLMPEGGEWERAGDVPGTIQWTAKLVSESDN